MQTYRCSRSRIDQSLLPSYDLSGFLVPMKGNTENTWQTLSHATLSTAIRAFTFICSCLLVFLLAAVSDHSHLAAIHD